MTDTLHTRINPLTSRRQVVAQIGEATASEECGNLVSQCEQRRIAVARPAATTLANLRSEINRLDHWLQRDAADLARETSAALSSDEKRYVPPFQPAVFWAIASVISLLEVMVNKSGMDGLGFTDYGSWAMALMAALCLFFGSKLTGPMLRQQPWRQGEWGGVAIALLFHAALIVAAIHVAEARAFVAAQQAKSDGLEILAGGVGGFVAFVLLGYGVMLFAAYRNAPPCASAEQRIGRIAALRKAVDKRWSARVKLAQVHNTTLAAAEHDLANLLHDLAERSHQFRCGVKRGGLLPGYFRQALPLNAVMPIDLGQMIDPQPQSIATLIGKDVASSGAPTTFVNATRA